MLSASEYDEVMERLSAIEDPELGVNIVDLELIYGLDNTGDALQIDMTLTYAGCPLTDVIEDGVFDSLLGLRWIPKIHWVWIPVWSLARVTDEGREQLRALGFNVDAVHASHTA